jgi:quinol monooxygenase YgiN
MTFGLFGTFVAGDGQRDELVGHLLRAAALLGDDPACLQYVVGTHGETEVSIFELWDDEAAHDSSLQREDIRGIINIARPLIATMASQTRLEVQGGKGV